MRVARKIMRLMRLGKGKAREFRTHMNICATCHTVTPTHEYLFDDLLPLYRDYRGDRYNQDRISVEPSYARIAKHVGEHSLEIRNRNAAVESFLRGNAAKFSGGRMMDYGGSDGRFLTPFMHETFDEIQIFDPSEAPLHASVDAARVCKIASPAENAYQFLACMHVLEHVGNPRAFVTQAANYLVQGGLMYVEIPLELTEETRDDLRRRMIDNPVVIHEHMNKFDNLGVKELVKSVSGLELIDSATGTVDVGWTKGDIGRYLIQKN
jgi:hypothetical protein